MVAASVSATIPHLEEIANLLRQAALNAGALGKQGQRIQS